MQQPGEEPLGWSNRHRRVADFVIGVLERGGPLVPSVLAFEGERWIGLLMVRGHDAATKQRAFREAFRFVPAVGADRAMVVFDAYHRDAPAGGELELPAGGLAEDPHARDAIAMVSVGPDGFDLALLPYHLDDRGGVVVEPFHPRDARPLWMHHALAEAMASPRGGALELVRLRLRGHSVQVFDRSGRRRQRLRRGT